MLAALTFSMSAFAGSWIQEGSRPANSGGVSNWWWRNNDGSYPAGGWYWIDGDGNGTCECYYFNSEGYMLASTTTPDNYQVNADGAWIKNGTVQLFPNQWAPGTVLTADNVRDLSASLNPVGTSSSVSGSGMSSGLAAVRNAGSASVMSDSEAYAKLMQIQAEYPNGTPWDNNEMYVSGNRYGYGCAAFIFMVQDRLYGANAKFTTVNTLNMSDLRVGDHLRVRNNSHSVIVLSVGDGYITVAEGNYNNSVHWGRTMTESELRSEFVYRQTAY